MEILFIAISIIVIIITINIRITLSISYNIYKNLGQLKLKVLGIPIFNSEISLIAGYFNLRRENRKVIQIKIDINDKNLKLIGDIGEYFSKKIFLTNLSTDFEFYGTNPAKIAIIAGHVIVIEGVLRSVINSKSPDTTITNNIDVGYIDNYIKFRFSVGILITLFDFIWAIIRALVKRSLYGKAKYGRNS